MASIISDISRMITDRMEELHMPKSALGKKLDITAQSVTSMLERKGFQANRLIQVSQALNYNYFQYIADRIKVNNPPRQADIDAQDKIKELSARVESLSQQVVRLSEENSYLKKIVDTFSSMSRKSSK